MAKLNSGQINELRWALSIFAADDLIKQVMERNNRPRLWKAYKARELLKLSISGIEYDLDFSCVPVEPSSESVPVKSSLESVPVVVQPNSVPVAGRNRKKLVKKVTGVALDPDVLEQLQSMADIRECSVSYLIRLSISEFLKSH